jgi:Tol biopolymer transport system component
VLTSSPLKEIAVIDIPGGQPRRLTMDLFDDESPSWHPNGKWLIFSSGRPASGAFAANGLKRAFIYELDKGTIEPIWKWISPHIPEEFEFVQMLSPIWSPRQDAIAFGMVSLGSCRLSVYNIGNDSLTILSIIPTPVKLRWSPSGRYVAFDGVYIPSLDDIEALWHPSTAVGFVDLQHDSTTIVDTTSRAFLVDWSPDGDRILLGNRDTTLRQTTIYEFDVRRNRQVWRDSLQADELVGYGQTSSEVLFLRDTPRGRDVWCLDMRTHQYQQITFDCPYMEGASIFRRR